MGSEIEVTVRRLGAAQRFAVEAPGDPREWTVVQWASKPRPSKGKFHPWWYEEGHTWHLYRGEAPKAVEGEMSPPEASFTTLEEAKEHVRKLVAGSPPSPRADDGPPGFPAAQ